MEKAPQALTLVEERQTETAAKIARSIVLAEVEHQPVTANISAFKKAVKSVMPKPLALVRAPVLSKLAAKKPAHKPERLFAAKVNYPSAKTLSPDIKLTENFPKPEIGNTGEEIMPLAVQPENSVAEVSDSEILIPAPTATDRLNMIETPTDYEIFNSEWADEAIREILGSETVLAEAAPEIEDVSESEVYPAYLSELEYSTVMLDEGQTIQVKDQLSDYHKVLDHEELESVIEVVNEIVNIARRLHDDGLNDILTGTNTDHPEEVIKELRKACSQLLVSLHIEPDLKKLEMFLLDVQSSGFAQNKIMLKPSLEEGTHEQKKNSDFIFGLLLQFINQRPELPLHSMVGRLALRFKLTTPKALQTASVLV